MSSKKLKYLNFIEMYEKKKLKYFTKQNDSKPLSELADELFSKVLATGSEKN
jgi:hypothetical protein